MAPRFETAYEYPLVWPETSNAAAQNALLCAGSTVSSNRYPLMVGVPVQRLSMVPPVDRSSNVPYERFVEA